MGSVKLPKPKIGEPCNGCGICCHIQICNTGAFLLRKTKYFGEKTIKGKCPALIQNDDNTFSCGFVVKPSKFIKSKYRNKVISRTVSFLIGAGTGCDSLGYDENNEEESQKLDAMMRKTAKDPIWIEAAKKHYELLTKF